MVSLMLVRFLKRLLVLWSANLGPAWINGWTGRMALAGASIISKATKITGIASSSNTSNIGCMGFYVTQSTGITAFNYVRFALTPPRTNLRVIAQSWTELSN